MAYFVIPGGPGFLLTIQPSRTVHRCTGTKPATGIAEKHAAPLTGGPCDPRLFRVFQDLICDE